MNWREPSQAVGELTTATAAGCLLEVVSSSCDAVTYPGGCDAGELLWSEHYGGENP
jgi:hypothetical protein